MAEPMSDARLDRLAGLAELPCTCGVADCENFMSALTREQAQELVAEARRARAGAGRCRSTIPTELYGAIRCDKPAGHSDDHQAQTGEAVSQWSVVFHPAPPPAPVTRTVVVDPYGRRLA
jgi:hypothetical protein